MKQPYHLLTLSLLTCFAFALVSCDKDQAAPNPHQINFQAPVIGQENYYLRFSGQCGELEPTGDTLILRIKGFDGTNLELEEIFTEGSPSYYPQSFVYPAKWSVDTLEIHPDFRQISSIFFFYGSDFLQLKQSVSKSMTQNNCIVWDGSLGFRGDKIGVVPAFKVGNLGYINKKVVSCVPTILDLDAYLVYDSYNIYSSYTMNRWEFWDNVNQNIIAYALIELEQ